MMLEGFMGWKNWIRLMDEEEWRTIDEFPRYQVNNYGDVWDTVKRKYLRQSNAKGYKLVSFRRFDGSYAMRSVHRLVAIAFLGRQDFLEVNHIDGDKSNNVLENLEWVTHYANMRHCIESPWMASPGRKRKVI